MKSVNLLKKISALCICFYIAVSFASCVTLFFSEPNHTWIVEQARNEWNDPLGTFYARFNGISIGLYSHIFASGTKTTIKDIKFSLKEGLSFITSNDVFFMDDDNVTVTMKQSDTEGSSFRGHYYNMGNYGKITIPYSDELLEMMLINNTIVRFVTSQNYRCQFNFPTKFANAYAKLIKKTT